MGNIQQGPVLDKTTFDNSVGNVTFGVCEMQGWRHTMEDSSLAIPYFDKKNSIFGVMDGHGGDTISNFVSQNFLNVFTNTSSYQKHNYEQALVESFLQFDEMLREEAVNSFLSQNKNLVCDSTEATTTITTSFINKRKVLQYYNTELDLSLKESKPSQNSYHFISEIESLKSQSGQCNLDNQRDRYHCNGEKSIADNMGTTANIVFLTGNYIYLANAGDSLSVMFKNGKAIKLNQEHKISLVSEYERIIKNGAKIINKRIEGKLNLSRAIGDLRFKKVTGLKSYEQSVTPYPEINKYKLTSDVEFIIMGCDGLWDCVDAQKLCEMVSNQLKDPNRPSLSKIIAEVFDQIISRSNTGIL